MFVVEAVDPDNIICHVADSSSELTELMKYLEESYKGKFHKLKQSCQKVLSRRRLLSSLSAYCPFALPYSGIPLPEHITLILLYFFLPVSILQIQKICKW